jgi:hypothetical protein
MPHIAAMILITPFRLRHYASIIDYAIAADITPLRHFFLIDDTPLIHCCHY